jgi:hypothetical protein
MSCREEEKKNGSNSVKMQCTISHGVDGIRSVSAHGRVASAMVMKWPGGAVAPDG